MRNGHRRREGPVTSDVPIRPISEEANASPSRPFPPELQEQAAENAGGWVYDIDPAFQGTGSIPPERIIGAWRIDDTGSPTDEFVTNPYYYYRPSSPKRRRSGRRLIVAAFLLLNAIVIPGLLVVLLVSHTKVNKPVQVISSVAPPARRGTSTAAPSTAAGHRRRTGSLAASPAPLRLAIVTTARVWICLEDERGRLLINGQIFDPGVVSDSFVAPSFRIFLGNASIRFRINGQLRSVPSSPDPVAYSLTRRGILALPAHAKVPCV